MGGRHMSISRRNGTRLALLRRFFFFKTRETPFTTASEFVSRDFTGFRITARTRRSLTRAEIGVACEPQYSPSLKFFSLHSSYLMSRHDNLPISRGRKTRVRNFGEKNQRVRSMPRSFQSLHLERSPEDIELQIACGSP